jgi:hypothetical protein
MSGVFWEIPGKHTAKPNSRKTVVLVDVKSLQETVLVRIMLKLVGVNK